MLTRYDTLCDDSILSYTHATRRREKKQRRQNKTDIDFRLAKSSDASTDAADSTYASCCPDPY